MSRGHGRIQLQKFWSNIVRPTSFVKCLRSPQGQGGERHHFFSPLRGEDWTPGFQGNLSDTVPWSLLGEWLLNMRCWLQWGNLLLFFLMPWRVREFLKNTGTCFSPWPRFFCVEKKRLTRWNYVSPRVSHPKIPRYSINMKRSFPEDLWCMQREIHL